MRDQGRVNYPIATLAFFIMDDKMRDSPAFQLFAADFFMDTLEWSVDEVGIYWRLLQAQWVNETLPNDIQRLARIAGCGPKKFSSGWKKVKSKFKLNGDGRFQNERLEETREKQRKYRELLSEAGKEGAKKRWLDDKVVNDQANGEANNNPNSQTMPLQSSSSLTNIKDIQTSFVFPLRDGEYELGKEKVLEYQHTYQNIDIMQTLKECIQWNRDNEARRKTSRGILKHINAWLKGANEDKSYVAKAPEMPEHERDTRTPEQKKVDMAKFKAFAGATVKKLKRIT